MSDNAEQCVKWINDAAKECKSLEEDYAGYTRPTASEYAAIIAKHAPKAVHKETLEPEKKTCPRCRAKRDTLYLLNGNWICWACKNELESAAERLHAKHFAARAEGEDDVPKALRELLVAVTYKTPTVEFGDGNPCYEARVPIAFVNAALAALAKGDGHGTY